MQQQQQQQKILLSLVHTPTSAFRFCFSALCLWRSKTLWRGDLRKSPLWRRREWKSDWGICIWDRHQLSDWFLLLLFTVFFFSIDCHLPHYPGRCVLNFFKEECNLNHILFCWGLLVPSSLCWFFLSSVVVVLVPFPHCFSYRSCFNSHWHNNNKQQQHSRFSVFVKGEKRTTCKQQQHSCPVKASNPNSVVPQQLSPQNIWSTVW